LQPDSLRWLLGKRVETLDAIIVQLEPTLANAPAARAGIDMALHDALAKCQQRPLVELLGQCHRRLPTSVTIGIKSLEASLEEAREYLAAGFKSLKLKIGLCLERDIEIVTKLREVAGRDIGIRVDANQGYDRDDFIHFVDRTQALKLEFIEQPFKAAQIEAMRSLDEGIRQHVVADESLFTEQDASVLAAPPQRVWHI